MYLMQWPHVLSRARCDNDIIRVTDSSLFQFVIQDADT